MLIDWINTFGEPRCLVSSGMEDLKNFLVVSDILKCILKEKGVFNNFEEQFTQIENSNEIKERIEIIFNILSVFYEEKILISNFSDVEKVRLYLKR